MRRLLQAASRLRRCDGGAAAVEFAIISWVLILVCLGVIEFGRGFYLRNQLSYVADCAAREILLKSNISDDELEEKVRLRCPGTPEDLAIPPTSVASGFRTFTLSLPFTLLVPGLASDSISISVVRHVPVG